MKNEYIAYLDGSRIDNKGFKTSYGVTAYTLKEAKRLLAKAKMFYHGTYRVENCGIARN